MNDADTKQATMFKQYLERIEKLAKQGQQARAGRTSRTKGSKASAAEERTTQIRASGKAKSGEKQRSPNLRKAA